MNRKLQGELDIWMDMNDNRLLDGEMGKYRETNGKIVSKCTYG